MCPNCLLNVDQIIKDFLHRSINKMQLSMHRKSFRFMGAKIYNELPIEIRKAESFSDYSNLLKKHFSY